MSYGSDKNQAYLNRLQDQISDFISNYNANPSEDNRITLFLFPGGLGSKLMRAEGAWPAAPWAFDTAWLDCQIMFGAFTNLQRSGNDDYQDRFIVPDQYIDFFDVRPYAQFVDWCQQNWLDLFVFGWDWRLTTDEAAIFFLQQFMPLFKQRTMPSAGACNGDPLANAWLIGHSFGGLIVKKILNQHANSYVQNFTGALTVGTSFYGYGGQNHRYFVGDPQINFTEGFFGARAVTRMVSSMPGPYELMFLDGATYAANQANLANDPQGYPLNSYPSMDPTTATEADPYNPVPPVNSSAANVRYLSTYGFSAPMLLNARTAVAAFAQALDPSVAAKFTNIRGVQTDGVNDLYDTVVAQTWTRAPKTFDPDNGPDHIIDIPGPGDGTLPAWATRFVADPAPKVITVRATNLDHMDLLNHADIQTAVASVIAPLPSFFARLAETARTVKMEVVSRAELNRLLEDLLKVEPGDGNWTPKRRADVRKILIETSGGDPRRLQPYLSRAYLDALKAPSQIWGKIEKR